MDNSSSSSSSWALALATITFVATLLGLLVDSSQLLGASQKLQSIGKYVLVLLLILAALVIVYTIYQNICWRNSLKIRRIQEKLEQFLDKHDGTISNVNIDVREIYLIHHTQKAVQLFYSIIEFNILGPIGDNGKQRLELVVDKGRDHGLVAGMKFSVQEVHNKALGVVVLKDPGEPLSFDGNGGVGILGIRNSRFFLPIDPDWKLTLSELTKKSFQILPIMPDSMPAISNLLSAFIYELDREWRINDIWVGIRIK
jgi:hypothetical protein